MLRRYAFPVFRSSGVPCRGRQGRSGFAIPFLSSSAAASSSGQSTKSGAVRAPGGSSRGRLAEGTIRRYPHALSGPVVIGAKERYPDPASPAPGPDRRAKRRTLVLSHSDPATGLPVGTRPALRGKGSVEPDYTAEQVLAAVLSSVDDDKAEEIVQIDLRGRSDVADYMVICSGRSSRQVAAIAEKLADRLKQAFGISVKMEGKETGDWVLIDSGDVVVHVFRPEVREFYQLEKMWMPAGQAASRPAQG